MRKAPIIVVPSHGSQKNRKLSFPVDFAKQVHLLISSGHGDQKQTEAKKGQAAK